MTPLRQALEDYLRIRRQLGFDLKATERHLNNFVDFLERAGAQRITIELAVMWAQTAGRRSPALVQAAAGVRARVRALSGDDRSRQRGPPTQLLLARAPAGRALHLLASRDHRADARGRDAHAAVSRERRSRR